MLRGGVDVHPDPVHAAFDHRVEPGLEFPLVDAVLVLPDADRLGVDFHQLRERVDQPSADAHRAAHRHVVIGKLLARRGRRRVDRCAVLADHEYLHGSVQSQAAHQLLGFAPRRTVADCEGLGPVFPRQRPQRFRRFGIAALRRVRVDGRIVHEVALRVQDDDFAARAESGVDGNHALLPQRRRKEQLPQVFGEYPDRLVVGLLFGGREQLGLYRRSDEPLERVGHGGFHICARSRSGTYEPAAERFGDALRVGVDRDAQDPLVFAATHGQEPVRRDAAQRRCGVEVVRILRPLGLLALHELRVHRSFASHRAPHGVAGLFVLGYPLGDDVAGSCNGLFGGRYLGRDEALRLMQKVVCPLCHDDVGQRFQPAFAGRRGACAALGFVGQVDVLQLHRVPALFDPFAELPGQFALPLDGRQDGLPAGFQLGEPVQLFFDRPDLQFVERAGRFLAVAADEGDRGAFAQQAYRALHLREADPESLCYDSFRHSNIRISPPPAACGR